LYLSWLEILATWAARLQFSASDRPARKAMDTGR
jgi:hypothetical protein